MVIYNISFSNKIIVHNYHCYHKECWYPLYDEQGFLIIFHTDQSLIETLLIRLIPIDEYLSYPELEVGSLGIPLEFFSFELFLYHLENDCQELLHSLLIYLIITHQVPYITDK
jgi:hypothetical protein